MSSGANTPPYVPEASATSQITDLTRSKVITASATTLPQSNWPMTS